MVEELEDPAKGGPASDQEIIRQLEAANDNNPNKDCRRWFLLLRELQIAAGNKHTIRQINTKHINTRSRWSVPFKSLNEVGYLIKNQFVRGVKRCANSDTKSAKPERPRRRTNIEKKNLAAIKAVRKYICHKDLFWCYDTMSVPSASAQAEIAAAYPDIEEVSEPERWIRAMIRRHGKQMVDYMDCCAINLANSYIIELNDRETTDGPMENVTSDDIPMVVSLLSSLIDEILAKSKPISSAFHSLQARPKPTSTSQPNLTSILGISPNTNSAGVALNPVSGGSNGTENVDYMNSYVTPLSSTSERRSQRPQTANADDDGDEIMSDGDRPAFAKRSKSHILLSRKEEVLRARPPMPSTSATFMNASLYSNAHGNSTRSSSNSLFQSNLADTQHNANTGEEMEECMPCEDGLFTQFIDYESSSNHDPHVCRKSPNNDNMKVDTKMPGELAEGIFNLSVANSGVPFHDTHIYLQEHHLPHDQNYLHQQNQHLYDAFPRIDSHSQPTTAHNANKNMDYGYQDNVDNADNISMLIDNNSGTTHAGVSGGIAQTPTSISRSTSDGVLPQQKIHSRQFEANMQPQSQEQQQQQSIPDQLQSIFGNSDSAFTFQLPHPSYAWPPEHSVENHIPHSQQMTDMLSHSIAPLQQAPGHGTSAVLPVSSMTSAQQSAVYTSNSMQMSLDLIANAMPAQTETNKPRESRKCVRPQQENDSSKLTTTLVMVNGVPSHVELLHDNMEVSPNPIILPISRIKE
ncbi:hypothetical protein H4R20_000507 [Coemansia guatemalensis]|uniref:Uncharacterized protein n=1 Tax=Coemansia guatemalensis TaxID=2761395 RepID=A0A9W8I545_9FUNG|nr:hypothetical protein H4R20_000507 [Coemansia guatemalensis]